MFGLVDCAGHRMHGESLRVAMARRDDSGRWPLRATNGLSCGTVVREPWVQRDVQETFPIRRVHTRHAGDGATLKDAGVHSAQPAGAFRDQEVPGIAVRPSYFNVSPNAPRTFRNTASIIGGVSFPVWVFWRLG